MGKNQTKKIGGGIGWLVIIGTHLLILPLGLSQDQVFGHAVLNLLGVGLIIWSVGGINKFLKDLKK